MAHSCLELCHRWLRVGPTPNQRGDSDGMGLAQFLKNGVLPMASGWAPRQTLPMPSRWPKTIPNQLLPTERGWPTTGYCRWAPVAHNTPRRCYRWLRIGPQTGCCRWHGVGPPPDAADGLPVAWLLSSGALSAASGWPVKGCCRFRMAHSC